jgi:hypothetical protein
MAVSFVASYIAGVANGTSCAINGIGTTNGNLLVATAGGYSSGTPQNYVVTDNKSNTWTENASSPTNPSGNVRNHQRYAFNITGGAGHNFTQTAVAAAYQTLIITEFAGVDTTSPFDKSAAATGSSSSPSSGATANRTQAAEVLIGSLGTGDNVNGGTLTAGASFTIPSGGSNTNYNNFVSAVEYQIVSGVGTDAATFTISSDAWGAIIGTFKASGAPTPPVSRNLFRNQAVRNVCDL